MCQENRPPDTHSAAKPIQDKTREQEKAARAAGEAVRAGGNGKCEMRNWGCGGAGAFLLHERDKRTVSVSAKQDGRA